MFEVAVDSNPAVFFFLFFYINFLLDKAARIIAPSLWADCGFIYILSKIVLIFFCICFTSLSFPSSTFGKAGIFSGGRFLSLIKLNSSLALGVRVFCEQRTCQELNEATNTVRLLSASYVIDDWSCECLIQTHFTADLFSIERDWDTDRV